MSKQQLEELRAAAEVASEPELIGLLSKADAARAFELEREAWGDRGMRARTLGERKQLARGVDRDQLARLATDLDPAVVRALLQNPRCTEREVLIAAARRPARAAVLEEIFRSARWAQNRRVRRALALNPYSPPALASRPRLRSSPRPICARSRGTPISRPRCASRRGGCSPIGAVAAFQARRNRNGHSFFEDRPTIAKSPVYARHRG